MAWGSLLPCGAREVITYVHHFADKLNPSTISRRLTAILNWYTYQSFPAPSTNPLVRKTMKGIRNTHGRPPAKMKPITLELLHQIVNLVVDEDKNGLRDAAIIFLGFYGAFRKSELVALTIEDIQRHKKGVEIMISRSKTDQEGEGITCAIPYSKGPFCAVKTLERWLDVADIEEGLVFRRVTKSDGILDKGLSPNQINLIVIDIVKLLDFDPSEFGAHSLRRGFATVASQRGASLSTIMKHGRWDHVETALEYVDEGKRFGENPVKFF